MRDWDAGVRGPYPFGQQRTGVRQQIMSDTLTQQDEQLAKLLQEAEDFPTDVRQGVESEDLMNWALRLEEAASGVESPLADAAREKAAWFRAKHDRLMAYLHG